MQKLAVETTVNITSPHEPDRPFEMRLTAGMPCEVWFKTKAWWFGSQEGRVGYFPISCTVPAAPRLFEVPTHSHTRRRGSLSQLEQTKAPPPPAREAVALYSFTAQTDIDLSIKKGDVIEILDAQGSWWTGRFEGKQGKVPSNYLKLL